MIYFKKEKKEKKMEELSKLIFDNIKKVKKEIKSCEYTFDAFLGEGTFGKVYKIMGTNEVVKIIPISKEIQSEIAIHQYLSNISKYVLPFLGISECKNDALIKFPLGISLHDVLKFREFLEFDVNNPYYSTIKKLRFLWAEQIALGLRDIHDNGILHLDMKPSNVILIPDESNILKATLSDFGLSQFIDGGNFGKSGNEVVTSWFRDINISCGENYRTFKSDVWSYGLLLMQLFFGFDLNKVKPHDKYLRTKIADELKRENLSSDQLNKKMHELHDSIWIAEHLFKYGRVPHAFKTKMLSTKCKPIFELFKEEPINYMRLLDDYDYVFLKNTYYSAEEWKEIWDVINACLDLNITTRPFIYEIIDKFSLFKIKGVSPRHYLNFKRIPNYSVDEIKIVENVKNLTKIWLETIKNMDVYRESKPGIKSTIIQLLINRAAEILGYTVPYELGVTLKDFNINLNRLFPNGVLENCCNYI